MLSKVAKRDTSGTMLTVWMPRISHRLLAVELGVRVEELWHWTEELTIAVDCPREGLGEPVQRCTVKHFVHRWSLVSPLLELLSNPKVALVVWFVDSVRP